MSYYYRRFMYKLLWPRNLIYGITGKHITEDQLRKIISNNSLGILLSYIDDQSRDIIERRLRFYESNKSVAESLHMSTSKVSTIMTNALDYLEKYADSLLDNTIGNTQLDLESDIVLLGFSEYIYRRIETTIHNQIGYDKPIMIKDLIRLYKTRIDKRESSGTKLMAIPGIGEITYYQITDVLKEHKFIDEPVIPYKTISYK